MFQINGFIWAGRQSIKKGGLAGLWLGSHFMISITDPEVAEYCLRTFLKKSEILRFTRQILGNGSIFAPVSIWRPRRKVMVPTFSLKQLMNFVQIFAKQSAILADSLEAKVDSGPFQLWMYLVTYAFDSVCETTMGVQIGAQKDHDHDFLYQFSTGCKLISTRILRPWLHSDAIFKFLPDYQKLEKIKEYLNCFIDSIIDLKEKEHLTSKEDDKNSEIDKTFLDLLLGSSKAPKLSKLEIREEILVLMGAGSDTSAVGACFVAVMLSRHQEVQQKVYKELAEVFGDSQRLATAEDLSHLTYLDAVVKETLRLYPPAPVIARDCDQDTIMPSGVNIPGNSILLINIWGTHPNPKYWGEDAEEYRPERFLEGPLKHPAQFLPFSNGPRNCLGYKYAMTSMKMAMSTILRRFKLLPETSDPCDLHKPIRLTFDIMMKDVDGFTVKLEYRSPLRRNQ